MFLHGHDAAVVGLLDRQLHPAVPVGRNRTSNTIRWKGTCSTTSVESCSSAPGKPDRVVELAPGGRGPVRLSISTHPPRTDDPTWVRVGVVEHVEHRLGWCGDRGSGCGPSAAGEQYDGAIGDTTTMPRRRCRALRRRRAPRVRRPVPGPGPAARPCRPAGQPGPRPEATPYALEAVVATVDGVDRIVGERAVSADGTYGGSASTSANTSSGPQDLRAGRSEPRLRPRWRRRCGAPTRRPRGRRRPGPVGGPTRRLPPGRCGRRRSAARAAVRLASRRRARRRAGSARSSRVAAQARSRRSRRGADRSRTTARSRCLTRPARRSRIARP